MTCTRVRFACSVLAAGLLVTWGAARAAAPAAPVGVTQVTSAPAPTAAAHPAGTQAIRVDAVNIEGKLYSPQALFIVSRPAERFERDAVVPHYLQLAPATAALPYRLRPELLRAATGSEVRPARRRAD